MLRRSYKETVLANKGFTLVEISIVLVIIGLIAGGIVGGSSLVQNARIKKTLTLVDSFRASTFMFRDKYDYFPGDMPTATSYWSGTANGNGDNGILYNTEGLRAWQHLSLAGMVAGSYTGVAVTGQGVILGQNVPEIPVRGASIIFQYDSTRSLNVWHIGKPTTATDYCGCNAAFTPSEMKSIDTKIDDGIANTGKVQNKHTWDTVHACTGGTVSATPNYDISRPNEVLCRLDIYI